MPHAAAPVIGRISAAPGANIRRVWSENFRAVRAETERRAAHLSPEDQIVQSMADASPAKWHRAHTTWFFETFLLKPHAANYREFDERFGFLFNSYYVAAGPRHARPERGLITRPSVEEVAAYRAHVDAAVGTASGQRGPGDAGKNRSDRRDRAASRAAASGADAHRHPARLRAEPDPSRPTTRRGSRRRSKRGEDYARIPRASVRSVSMATASASTTSSRRIRCCCRRPSSRATSSPMASG